ncbi:MAG: TIGR01777 family oxidoreductase [Chitinophagaceae bacterium]|nr:TIGR01777 family oxidoreductase [Chitinophagaceae bacterium]
MATVLITGGTGMIGKAITKVLLTRGHAVIILSRNDTNNKPAAGNFSYARWDIQNMTIDKEAIAKANYIIHLAGAGVADKRWSKRRKQEIVDSRVKSGELLVKALNEIPNNVKAVISASAIGWYGPDPVIPNPHPFTEDAIASNDFLGTTCKQWEESIEPVTIAGKRLVKLRIGIVLSKEGGALKELLKPLYFSIATILGNGKQVISWIHIDDLARLFIAAMENENMSGIYNAVSPHPVSNKELILQLASVKQGRFFIPFYVPSFVLKMVLGEMSIEVLKSATVSCAKVEETGFEFQYPSVKGALANLLK